MGIVDYLIIGAIAAACIGAVRFLKKNGMGCGGCTGDCSHCKKKG